MIEIPRTENRYDVPWPSWRAVKRDDTFVVVMRCSNGHSATLDHEIADDGIVSPSVVCPEEGCNFHEHVRLVGWNE